MLSSLLQHSIVDMINYILQHQVSNKVTNIKYAPYKLKPPWKKKINDNDSYGHGGG